MTDEEYDKLRIVKHNGVGAMYVTKNGTVITIIRDNENGYYSSDNGKLYNSRGIDCGFQGNDITKFIGHKAGFVADEHIQNEPAGESFRKALERKK